jgi:hypothetical protein
MHAKPIASTSGYDCWKTRDKAPATPPTRGEEGLADPADRALWAICAIFRCQRISWESAYPRLEVSTVGSGVLAEVELKVLSVAGVSTSGTHGP